MTQRKRVRLVVLLGIALLLCVSIDLQVCARCGTSSERIAVLRLGMEVPGFRVHGFPNLERAIGPCLSHQWYESTRVDVFWRRHLGCGSNGLRVSCYRMLDYIAQLDRSQARDFHQRMMVTGRRSEIRAIEQEMWEWFESLLEHEE